MSVSNNLTGIKIKEITRKPAVKAPSSPVLRETPSEVVKLGNPILRKKSKAVSVIDKNIKSLVSKMTGVMKTERGIGLAAPQIGVSLRVIVVGLGEEITTLINPKIVSKSGRQVVEEACLSIPGVKGSVERANFAKIKGKDIKGKQVEINAEGLLAQVYQHEIDHLNGKLFTDIAKDVTSDIDRIARQQHVLPQRVLQPFA